MESIRVSQELIPYGPFHDDLGWGPTSDQKQNQKDDPSAHISSSKEVALNLCQAQSFEKNKFEIWTISMVHHGRCIPFKNMMPINATTTLIK